MNPAVILPDLSQSSAKASKPAALVVKQQPTLESITSLLLSLPQELRLDILTRAVYSRTNIRLPHTDNDVKVGIKCKACKKDWEGYKEEVLADCQIFRGEHSQLHDEALNIFLQINTFSIECASGTVFLRNLLSEFVFDKENEGQTTGMSWIRRVEIKRLESSAFPIYHRFLVSCPQLSHLTIVLGSTGGDDFRFAISYCGLNFPVFAQVLTRLTTVVLDVTQRVGSRILDEGEDEWRSGRAKARSVLERSIPEARMWFGKRKGENFKVVVRVLAKSWEKMDFQVLPRTQLTNDMCDKLGLPHSAAVAFNQKQDQSLSWDR